MLQSCSGVMDFPAERSQGRQELNQSTKGEKSGLGLEVDLSGSTPYKVLLI